MKTFEYPIRIDKDPDSDRGASVPDLPGCVATGKTIDTTMHRMIRPRRSAGQVCFFATVRVAA